MDTQKLIDIGYNILYVLISTGLLALLARLVVNKVGDKLGWDEKKKAEVAANAINAAEEMAKHQIFATPELQAKFKENTAIGLVSKTLGIPDETAKVAVRAAFSISDLAKTVKFNEVAKFKDETNPEALIAGGAPCVKS